VLQALLIDAIHFRADFRDLRRRQEPPQDGVAFGIELSDEV
jgi:hypothetical protein